MKAIYKYLIAILVLTVGLSCGGDDAPPSVQEMAFERLAGAWDLTQGGSIVVDGTDATLNFSGFTLSFTDGAFNTTNAGDLFDAPVKDASAGLWVFDATGTWQWADTDAGTIQLGDGKLITIINLTENEFEFSFQFTGTGGEANGVDGTAGNYVITVNK